MAIGRALYYEPEILILDEATSSLDIETEEKIIDALKVLKNKLTIIIISHRKSTFKICDKIYELKDGRLNEIKKIEESFDENWKNRLETDYNHWIYKTN